MSERGPRGPEHNSSNLNESDLPFNIDGVIWLKGAIALDTDRDPSQVSNTELARRYYAGGRFEWDPKIVKQVKRYLKTLGFYVTLPLK